MSDAAGPPEGLRFLLDEDLPPAVASICRNLGLDARSVHELERTGLTDREQLRYAAGEGRVFVTGSRDDFLALTVEFCRAGEAHFGLLIVGRGLPNDRPERIPSAILGWRKNREPYPGSFGPYGVDFLRSGSAGP